MTATPTPVASVATPTPKPTPTPTPTPTPQAPSWLDWTFTWATLTVPKAGIDQAAITPLQPGELVQKEYVDANGVTAVHEAIDPGPDNPYALTWNTRVVDGVSYPIGSVLSASAANTNYLYCHDYANGEALCSTIFDVLVPGDVVTLETATEILTYTVQESFNLLKGDVAQNEKFNEVVAGRLVIVTCNSGGPRIEGATIENSLIFLQLTSAVNK